MRGSRYAVLCRHSDIALISYGYPKVLNSFDSLKDAWGVRKTELEGRVKAMGGAGLFGGGGMYGGGAGMYGGQVQEMARLEHVSAPYFPLLKSKMLIVIDSLCDARIAH